MKLSRRDLSFLLPAIATAQTAAPATPVSTQRSLAFRWEDLHPTGQGPLTSRNILKGTTHTGFLIDMHESELAAGEMPHAPHQHIHEEMVLIREGTLEVTIDGKATQLGPGSGAYVASNQLHGWRNVGKAAARYFVIALGEDKA